MMSFLPFWTRAVIQQFGLPIAGHYEYRIQSRSLVENDMCAHGYRSHDFTCNTVWELIKFE